MSDRVEEIRGIRVLICAEDGKKLAGEGDINGFLGKAWEQEATMVAIPVARLVDDFFRLRTRLAGAVVQKFVNYRLRLAVIGDISAWVAESDALRDFVREANRGRDICFAADLAELRSRL
ncbi:MULTISPECIES: DUF4180 domain-containing protein [Labrys]|uniref:DUF4180 domain-containing protein n=1 Tax=Labrys neptuniae TaxID=376174 RepID=A0ABV3PP21_9HYPH